jgi:DNA-binding CsgD family transcriptional regulator
MIEKRKNPDLRARIKKLEFESHILRAQHEVSLDAILVVDEQWRIISYNQRFVDFWSIPVHVLKERDDRKSIQTVLQKLENPEQFLEKVEYLMAHPEEKSSDILKLKDGRIFDRYSAPIVDIKEGNNGRVWFFRDITEITSVKEQLSDQNINLEKIVQKRTEELELLNEKLVAREQEVSIQKKQLTVMNENLRTMLHVLEEEKQSIKKRLSSNISEALLPLLDLLSVTSLTDQQLNLVETLENTLEDLCSSMNFNLVNHKDSFTPTEIRVANFIKTGKTTKEIADILHASPRTVEGHRTSIRKKLGLNRRQNLQTKLLTLQ